MSIDRSITLEETAYSRLNFDVNAAEVDFDLTKPVQQECMKERGQQL
jgi:hypothetical protein